MSLQAYITAGGTVIPALIPDQRMHDAATQIGIDPSDLFRVDVPAGMTRHVRACVMVASTQLSALYQAPTVSLTLDDSVEIVTLTNLYARPPQPLFWGQQGGTVLVELVDVRWWWKFTSAALLDSAIGPLWSSDGRWQVDGSTSTYVAILAAISTAASGDNLTSPSGYSAVGTAYIRRMSDLVGSPNVSLALLLDAIAVTTGQIIVSDGGAPRFINRTTLQAQYDARMNSYQRAMRGGMQPVNGASGGTDVLVSQWNAYGYRNRAPSSASVLMPMRSVEGQTVYDNVTLDNTAATQQNATQKSVYAAGDTPSWTRQPADLGAGYLTESAIVAKDATGAVLTTSPGWNPTAMAAQIRGEYATRYSATPFGRTVLAGWIPWYTNPTTTIGQVGNVSYRLAMIDGEMAPYTITECREEDWIFGLQGVSETDPSALVTAKGMAQAYRNAVGATIIDVPPPNTRTFPATITASEQIGNTWSWTYSFTEVEPSASGPAGTSIGAYARTAEYAAVNVCEAGNVFASLGHIDNVVAPGVRQSDYVGSTIEALPVCDGTVVQMVEQFNTQTNGPSVFWFCVPNAVKVACSS